MAVYRCRSYWIRLDCFPIVASRRLDFALFVPCCIVMDLDLGAAGSSFVRYKVQRWGCSTVVGFFRSLEDPLAHSHHCVVRHLL